MKIFKTAAISILFALICILSGAQILHHAAAEHGSKEPSAAQQPCPQDTSRSSLFPGIAAEDIASLSVTTQNGQFEFRLQDSETVSVNGRKADEEVFATLLAQIASLPVCPIMPFTPSAEPMMTLSIHMRDGARHTAFFYAGSDAGRSTHISSSSQSIPAFHATDTWRIGTMLLACEGTRIQDEFGRETPAD